MDKENSCYFREKVNKTKICYEMKCNIMKVVLDNLPGLPMTSGCGGPYRKPADLALLTMAFQTSTRI